MPGKMCTGYKERIVTTDNKNIELNDSNNGLIHAYLFNAQGGASSLDWSDLTSWDKIQGFLWIHLNADHPDTRQWLETQSGLDSVIIETLLDTDNEPRCLQEGESLIATFRGINFNKGSDPEDMVYINYFSDQYRAISVRSSRLFFIQDISNQLVSNQGPKNAAALLITILDCIHEKMEPTLDLIEEHLDEFEKNISKEILVDQTREELLRLRQEIIELRRFLVPQKNALTQLTKFNLTWLNKKNLRLIRKTDGRLQHFFAELDSYRERSIVIKDEINSLTSEKMNRAMYMLSIVTGVFLPLGFLTGLLGINVGGMPGVESKIAFWVVCGLLLGTFVMSIVIFKRNKWI